LGSEKYGANFNPNTLKDDIGAAIKEQKIEGISYSKCNEDNFCLKFIKQNMKYLFNLAL